MNINKLIPAIVGLILGVLVTFLILSNNKPEVVEVVKEVEAPQVSTLDIVKDRGKLMCGSNTGLAGFGNPNDAGVWEGIDVDVCRAVAAAVFGDASKV